VVDELCAEFKVPRTSILASVWKSKLGIKGKDRPAQKRAAQNWVVNTYNIKVIQDIADAVCIGTAYLKDIKKDVYDWS
jgi:phosphatidate phosphatase APP1